MHFVLCKYIAYLYILYDNNCYAYNVHSAPPHPVIHLLPHSKTTMIGRKAKFYCDIHTQAEKKWTFNDGPLPNNANIIGPLQKYIQISDIELSNAGVYKCITKDQNNSLIVSEGRLQVVGEP